MKKQLITAAILMVFLGVAVVHDAAAGLFDRFKSDQEETKVPPRYNLLPTMSFHKGVLGRDVGAAWTLGELKLSFAPTCEITSEAKNGAGLDEGREALVMGSKVGDTIVAWRVTVQGSDQGILVQDPQITFTPSEENPMVGVGTGPQ